MMNVAKFDGNALSGVCTLEQPARVHLLTATATDFLVKIVATFQKDQGEDWVIDFKSKSGYSNSASKQQQITKKAMPSREVMMETFFKDI